MPFLQARVGPRSWSELVPPYRIARHRAAFTLLELMLALSLTVVVLMLVNTAVEIHLRSLDKRRQQLEEAQLARSILRLIADDIRGAVLHYEQDTSSVEQLLQASIQSAASGALGSAVSAATGSGGSSGATTTGGGGGAASTGQSTSTTTSARTSSTGGSTSSGAATGSATSGTSSGGTATSSTSTTSTAGTEPTANTEDLTSGAIPAVPGLYGNQFQLQVDVSRLPRVEDYQRYLTADSATQVVDIPSDVKTVTYYVQSSSAAATSLNPSSAALESIEDLNANATGLVRRELDRSVTEWALNNGNLFSLQNSGDVLAPEVAAIEFQYFDGSQWVQYWDTDEQQKLPIAVLVILAIRPPGTVVAADVPPSSLTPETAGSLHLYRQLIYLPNGGQEIQVAAESSAEASTASSSSTGSETGATP